MLHHSLGGEVILLEKRRPLPSLLYLHFNQGSTLLSPIERVSLVVLHHYSCCDVTSQLASWDGGGATDRKTPKPILLTKISTTYR